MAAFVSYNMFAVLLLRTRNAIKDTQKLVDRKKYILSQCEIIKNSAGIYPIEVAERLVFNCSDLIHYSEELLDRIHRICYDCAFSDDNNPLTIWVDELRMMVNVNDRMLTEGNDIVRALYEMIDSILPGMGIVLDLWSERYCNHEISSLDSYHRLLELLYNFTELLEKCTSILI